MRVFTNQDLERHVNGNSFVEVPERYPAMLAGVEAARGAGGRVEYADFEPASEESLLAAHSAAYLESVKRASAEGGRAFDPDTACGPGSWEALSLASGAAVGAVEAAAIDGEVSFAVIRPPGHHATPERAMGFCLVNHAAVAARHAQKAGADRVAVLDWDVHHGNGTQEILYSDPDVLYLSVHRGGAFYPGSGYPDEIGEGEGRGTTVNAPLTAGSGEDLYRAVFEEIFFPVLREFEPSLLIVSAGYDAHERDPLGGMRLSSDSFGRFAASLAALTRELDAPPPAFVMEGGYDLRALTESVAATILGVQSDTQSDAQSGESPTEPPRDSRLVGVFRESLSPYWTSLREG